MARAGSEATATRIPSLDGLRALSISGVLVAHSFFAYHQTKDTWALRARNADRLSAPAAPPSGNAE